MNKKESHWFSHDENAMLDPKITLLMAEYRFEGYGRWWHVVELLRSSKDYRFSISGKYTYHILAQKLWATIEQAKKFIADLIDFELLQTDGEYIWSDSLLARMEYWNKKRQVLSEKGKKGVIAKREKQQAQLEESESTANSQVSVFQANETKLNDTKQDDTIPNDNPKPLKGLNDVSDDVLNTSNNNTQTSSPAAHWEQLKQTALSDTNFTTPHLASAALTLDKLAAWLSAFNRVLIYNSEPSKTASEYRRHFTNWFKYRDPWRENPDNFQGTGKAKPETIIDPLAYLKTPAQIQADLDRHYEERKKQREEERKRA